MTSSTSSAVAVRAAPSPLETPLGQMIEPYRAQLEPFLRDGLTLERVAAELMLAAQTTPNLDKCPAPLLVDAVCKAVATGGTIGQDVYIVPFFNSRGQHHEPTVIVDYKFKAELVVRAGGARSIDAHPVYSDEVFDVRYGSEPRLLHEPSKAPAKGRKLIGAYAVAFFGFNHVPKFKWMPLEDVEKIRAKSKQWNPEKVKECPAWYACARAVNQLVKLLPKNPKLKAILDVVRTEETQEFGAPEGWERRGEGTASDRPANVDEDGVIIEDEETPATTAATVDDTPASAQPGKIMRDTPIDWGRGRTAFLNGKGLRDLNGEQVAWLNDHSSQLPAGWSLAVSEEMDRRENPNGVTDDLFADAAKPAPKARNAIAEGR